MKKRILSFLVTVAMVCTMLSALPLVTNASTQLSANPYPKVEYNYINDTPVGTIRYIAQNTSSDYFNWNYWPSSSFGGYTGGPESECGTACISMALSYVGVNRTPKELLVATNGYTGNMWVEQDGAISKEITISSSAISSAMNDYINGGGKYSPLCIYIVPYSETSQMHWVLLVGKLGENKYLALNPWHTAGTDGTMIIQVNGSTATYNGITNPIVSVNQWYNENAESSAAYLSQCELKATYLTVKVEKATTLKSLPCSAGTSAESKDIRSGVIGETLTVTGMYRNTAGNYWYRVDDNGTTCYLYSGDTTVTKHLGTDITISNVSSPTSLTSGSVFSIKGDISATYNVLCTVQGYIYPGVVSGLTDSVAYKDFSEDTPWSKSYSLLQSKVDNGLDFNLLPDGTYTYVVNVVAPNYYCTDGTTLSTCWLGKVLVVQTFTVGSTSCSHSYSSEVTEPTCTEQGYTTYTCSKCGNSYRGTYTAATGHSYAQYTYHPECTEEGYVEYCCVQCGDSYISERLPATGHSFEYSVEWEPTETEVGNLMCFCTSCAEIEWIEIPVLSDSDYSYEVIDAATCTRIGVGQYTWNNTEYGLFEFDVSIPALGHNYVADVIPPECTEEGYTNYYCTRCSDGYIDTFTPPTGHDFEYSVSYEPSIDEEGEIIGVCNRCDSLNRITLPVLNTTDYRYQVLENATCKEFGVGRYTWKTSTFGVFAFDIQLAKTAHRYSVSISEPDCINEGYTTHLCTVCGHSYVDDIQPALGHNYATTWSKGEDGHWHECTACGDKIDMAAHNYGDGGKCDVCGHLLGVTRLAGASRWATALKVADEMKENLRAEKFDAVIVASGNDFADALAGSYLSTVKNAPILLSWGKGGKFEYLDTDNIDYIKNNLAEGGTVYLLGGENAVPELYESALADYEVKRLGGANRFETNLLILEEAGIPEGSEVLVCTSTNFADSLSASATGLPILLVFNESGALYGDQPDFLAGLNNCTFTVIGGENAVSDKLATAIGAYGNVSRLAGSDRFDTSVMVAKKYFDAPETAVLAYAWNYPDGLCGGALAYSLDAPLILTMTKYEAKAAAYAKEAGITEGVVLGGDSLISNAAVRAIFDMSADDPIAVK